MNYSSKRSFFWVLIFLFVTAIVVLIRNLGLLYFTDTISYLEMANRINKGIFPHSDSFSPGYPFLIAFFTKTFFISQIQSVYLSTLILSFCTFIVLYQLLKLFIDKGDRFSVKSFFLVFFIMANWLLLKVMLTAHADLFFLLLLSVYFLGITKWLFFEEKKGFYILLFTIALSVWIKYNAIILIPFSVFSILFYRKKNPLQNLISILIVLIVFIFTYTMFKEINGTVIQHLQTESFSEKISKSIKNSSLLISNFTLSGKIFFGAIFSKSAELLLPRLAATVFMFIVTIIFVCFLVVDIKNRTPQNIFLSFTFFYWLSFYALCQYTGWEEINSRTLFPCILTLYIWLIIQETRVLNFWKHFITALFTISIAYSFCYIIILNRSSKEKYLSYLTEFKNKKSLFDFNQIRKPHDFSGNIYSNDSRNLSFALDHELVKEYPKKIVFKNGKFRAVSESELKAKQAEFWSNFSTHKSALFIFNDTLDVFIQSHLNTQKLNVYKNKNDILIIHTD